MTVTETERLLLRHMTPDDLDELAALYGDPEVMYFWETTYTREETRERLERIIAHQQRHGYGLWATLLKPDGRFIGRCGLLHQVVRGRPEMEVAYMLARDCWGQGLATEAARAIRDYGFRTFNPPRLISLILEGNVRSRRVAERNGMRVIGEWSDEDRYPHLVYAITREEWAGATSPQTER